MNLEQRVYELENSVNQLRIDTVEIKAALKPLAQQNDLSILKTQFDTILPSLAKQEDVVAIKTKFDTTLPHLVTRTWLAGALVIIFLGQVFIPTIHEYLHFNTNQEAVQKQEPTK